MVTLTEILVIMALVIFIIILGIVILSFLYAILNGIKNYIHRAWKIYRSNGGSVSTSDDDRK